MLRRTISDYDKAKENSCEFITDEMVQHHIYQMQSNQDNSIQALSHSQLNFNYAYLCLFINKLIGHAGIERARAQNKYCASYWTNNMELLKQVKKLTSARELVKVANTHEIGINLLTEVRHCKAEADAEMVEKAMKKMKELQEKLHEYITMMKDKPDEKAWTSRDMKIAIHALKNDTDGKVLTLKKDLVAYYDRIKGRKENAIMEFNGFDDEHEMNG